MKWIGLGARTAAAPCGRTTDDNISEIGIDVNVAEGCLDLWLLLQQVFILLLYR